MCFGAFRCSSTALSLMLAAVAAIFVALVPIGEAEAGFWCGGQTTGEWTIPADGSVAPPETRVLTVFSNTSSLHAPADDESTSSPMYEDYIVVVDENGEEIDGEAGIVEMGHLTGIWPEDYGEFLPDEPLAEGEYDFVIKREDTDDTVLSTFSIDEGYESSSPPEAVEIQWFRKTQNKPQEGECGNALSEMHYLSVEPLADEPAYYEVLLEHSDGSETPQLLASDAYDGELRYYTFHDVECLSITAHLIDGTSGETTEYCEPHKCDHTEYPDDTEFGGNLGSTDWDEISGCEFENPGGAVFEDPENGGENGDDTENGDADGEDNGDVDGEDNGEDDDNGSCAAVSGSTPPIWMVLLVALGLMLRRKPLAR